MRTTKAKILRLDKENGVIEVSYNGMDPVALELPAKVVTDKEVRQLLSQFMPSQEALDRASIKKRRLDYSVIEKLINQDISVKKEDDVHTEAAASDETVMVYRG